MGRIGNENNVKYSLVSKSQGEIPIEELIGFEDGNGNLYKRDSKGKGFFKTRKDAIKLHGKGYRTILTQVSTKGVAEDMAIKKIEKDRNRLDEKWRGFPLDFLDLGTAIFEEKKGGNTGVVSVKTSQGGLRKTIDSKMNDELDLTGVVDIIGNTIPSLVTERIALSPKEIKLRSEFTVEVGRRISTTTTGGDTVDARAIPVTFNPNSDQENLQDCSGVNLGASGGDYSSLTSISSVFLLDSETDKVITLNGTIKIRLTRSQSGTMSFDLIRFKNGSDGDFGGKVLELDSGAPNFVGKIYEHTFVDYDVFVNKGDSLTFSILADTPNTGITFELLDSKIEIKENSGEFFPQTYSKVLTYKNCLERILQMIEGREIEVVSELLTTGELSGDVLLNGFWAREFPNVVKEGTDEERKIQFKTSLKDILKHLEALMPISWWVEEKGDLEVLRVESLKYAQQNNVTISFSTESIGGTKKTFPQASKIKRTLISKDFFSVLEFGSEKGGEGYEEVYGLQSISGKASFSTVNKNSASKYSKLSPYRLGDIDVELPRRKPFSLYPDTDTKYDSDIMCIRAKRKNGVFAPKTWLDDGYEKAPKGVFSPNTGYNYKLTPAQIMFKHAFVFKSGLYHYPNSEIVFSESNCNSSLVTKRSGQDEVRESPDPNTGEGAIPVSRLESPRTRPFSVDCSIQVTQEIEDQINGTQGGIPNLFGIIEINTGQTIEYFRAISIDANGDGKLKLIESFIS